MLRQVVMKLREMIQRVAEPDEAGPDRAQIGGFQRQRFEEVLDLLDRFDRRVVLDGFTGEPAADCIDRTVRDLQDRPPGGLERDRSSRFGEGRLETADGRLAARSGDPNDEPREVIEPRIEHDDARELEDAAECRQRQHAVRIVELGTHPVGRRRERSEKQHPEHADDRR